VKGNGFTDHCPVCLWGRHVDVNPGDRASSCRGMMRPIRVEAKSGKYLLYYKCKECRHKFRVRSAPNDEFDLIIKLINK